MIFTCFDRTMPKLVTIGVLFLSFPVVYLLNDFPWGGKLRVATLCLFLGVVACLPMLFEKIGWIDMASVRSRFQSKSLSVSSDTLRKGGYISAIFGAAVCMMMFSWTYVVREFGLVFIQTSVALLSWIIFEYTLAEQKLARGNDL